MTSKKESGEDFGTTLCSALWEVQIMRIAFAIACLFLFGCDVQRSGPDELDRAVRKHRAGASIVYVNPKDLGDIRVTGYGYLVDGRVWSSTGKEETNTYSGNRNVVRDKIANEMSQGTTR